MTRLPPESACWFINDDMIRACGTVVANVKWKGESLTVIEVDVSDEEIEFVVRPTDLVANSADAPLGFCTAQDDAWASIADLVLAQRERA
jgi:hypothetical protein